MQLDQRASTLTIESSMCVFCTLPRGAHLVLWKHGWPRSLQREEAVKLFLCDIVCFLRLVTQKEISDLIGGQKPTSCLKTQVAVCHGKLGAADGDPQ